MNPRNTAPPSTADGPVVMTTTVADYAGLSTEQRGAMRWKAEVEAQAAKRRCADLAATEAGLIARLVYPTLTKLVFSVDTNAVGGASVSLVIAYGPAADVLWNQHTNDEWPDESEVTDLLESAYQWDPKCFERFQHLHCLTIT